MNGYLARLAAGEGACRPTRRRGHEWDDEEQIDDLIPARSSRSCPVRAYAAGGWDVIARDHRTFRDPHTEAV